MCSKSNVNDALKGVSGSSGGSVLLPSIAAHQVKQHRDAFFLVDIREPSEVAAKPWTAADTTVTMGAICHDATDLLAQVDISKTLVVVCNTGARAELAAQSILAQSPPNHPKKVAVLQRGLVGWENPAAVSPDFLVVLGLGDSSEKLSLALAAVSAAVDLHSTVVLVLMSDGVNWFLKPDSPKVVKETPNVETISVGDPFKPCKAMLNKFLSSGGTILCCTTCILHRGYTFETDMMDCVKPLQMPDLVRMLGEAKGGSLQFM
jgi:rhodanese-related sulfurtransferase/sulfur relay (sulfurtransferase) complex TusBCD TusD component (DsrE family)